MNNEIYKPIIIDSKQASLFKKNKHADVVDYFESQLQELFLIRNPSYRFKPLPKINLETPGTWVYYPWRNTLVHLLDKSEFYELRTARNRNLITKKEQYKIRNSRIGISGLSVGNSIALTLALEGFRYFCLADYDDLSVSNLNRLRSSLVDLGQNKALIAARQIYEINPYAEVEIMAKGIKTNADLKKFFNGLDLIVDETDDVNMRLNIRKLARSKKLSVISAADNGYNAVVDIERFDLEPKRPIYHGYLSKFDIDKVDQMNFGEKFALINAMVGVDLVAGRMKQSLLEVGRTLYSWPQLAGAAMLSGATIAYIAKQIVLGNKISSGKYDVNLERIFMKDYDLASNKNKRSKETAKFLKAQAEMFKTK